MDRVQFFFRISLNRALIIIYLLSVPHIGNSQNLVADYYNVRSGIYVYRAGAAAGISTPATFFKASNTGPYDSHFDTSYRLPFNFNYNGTVYTTTTGYVTVTPRGWIAFSNGLPPVRSIKFWDNYYSYDGRYLCSPSLNNGVAGFNCMLNCVDNYSVVTGKTTLGSNIMTNVSAAGFTNLQIGLRLIGTYFPAGTVVTDFNQTAQTITLSANALITTTSVSINLGSSIYAYVKDAAPNRQFVIQYTGVKSSNGVSISFQIILSEAGGVSKNQTIRVMYGPVDAGINKINAQVGLRGASASDFNAVTTIGISPQPTNWNNFLRATNNWDYMIYDNITKPSTGISFTWSPCVGSAKAGGVISGNSAVCPGSTQVYALPAANDSASGYVWNYTGSNVTYNAVTKNRTNTFEFGNNATGGILSVTPRNKCGSGASSTLSITINPVSQANIQYSQPAYCVNSGSATVTRTGPGGGVYSASPIGGLSINSTTGAINTATSLPGKYIVSYLYAAGGGCTLTATTEVIINSLPEMTATSSPGGICSSLGFTQLSTQITNGDYQVKRIPYSRLTPDYPAPPNGRNVIWTTEIDGADLPLGTMPRFVSKITLPFTFNFYNHEVTEVFPLYNGSMRMGVDGLQSKDISLLANYNISFDLGPVDYITSTDVIALVWGPVSFNVLIVPGGQLSWFVNGAAPNRVFVLEYQNLMPININSTINDRVSGQIRLYESDYAIETSITKFTFVNSPSYGVTMGIVCTKDTSGFISPPGRSTGTWRATYDEAWRFEKNSTYSYSWTPSANLDNPNIPNPKAIGLTAAASYTVQVTDLKTSCTVNKTVSISAGTSLGGTYTVGAGGNFQTLTAAVSAYNKSCLSAPVVFELIDNLYNVSTGESFPIQITNNPSASATNFLTIKPATGKSPVIEGGLPVIRLLGADYVTIDGSNIAGGYSKNLKIKGFSSPPPHKPANASDHSCIHILTTDSIDGTNHNTIKNLNIDGALVQHGILIGSYHSNEKLASNNFNKIFNVYLTNAIWGIRIKGNNSRRNTGNVVDSCSFINVSSCGIEIESEDSLLLTRNTIRDIKYFSYPGYVIPNRLSDVPAGIRVLDIGKDCVIYANKLDSIGSARPYSATGILILNKRSNVNLLVANNMITDTYSNLYPLPVSPILPNAHGIAVCGGGGYKFYFNSICFSSKVIVSGTNVVPSSCFYIGPDCDNNGIDLRNNILANKLTEANSSSHHAMDIESSGSVFSHFDYNVFYAKSTGLVRWGPGSSQVYTTLANVRSAFGGNDNSIVVEPVFAGPKNLHLSAASNPTIEGAGQSLLNMVPPFSPYLNYILSDIDEETRNPLTTPDIGADEFKSPPVQTMWVGRVSTAWDDPKNWSGNVVPNNTTDTYIKGGFGFMPVIKTNQTVRILDISAPDPLNKPVLTIDGGGTLGVFHSINKTGGSVIGRNGTLRMAGNNAFRMIIPANLFVDNALGNLIVGVSNGHSGEVELAGPLDIYRSLTFTLTNQTLFTNDYLTFKSTATETAWLGNMTRRAIVGNATVERYIGTGVTAPLHQKSWQLLSVPVTGSQTVKAAWQEGAATPNANPNVGFGTQMTSDFPNATSLGFDVYTPLGGPSIKTFNPATNGWDGLPNTNSTTHYNKKGYMVFVRGDRSVQTYNATAVPTVLRTFGKLFTTGADAPPVTTVLAGRMESVGNPYVSAIDFRQVVRNNVSDIFYLWDPRLTSAGVSAYGLGGYQTFTKDVTGDYRVTPGGGSFGPGGSINNIIQSGAAFFVQSNQPLGGTDGTVSFSESVKVQQSALVHRESLSSGSELRINMHVMQDDEPVLIDGVLYQFDASNNNAVDGYDARKMLNTGESLAIKTDTMLLSVERRNFAASTDTLFLNLSNLRVQNYRFELIGNAWLHEMDAWLVDAYTGVYTPLSDTGDVTVDFTVINHPVAASPSRFYIVFRQGTAGPLPVRHIQLSGIPYREHTNLLKWDVSGEYDMDSYELQRSSDGRTFTTIYTGVPQNASSGSAVYQFTDMQPLKGNNYYRIKAISLHNAPVQYSNVVLLHGKEQTVKMLLYPNPSSGVSALQYEGLKKGMYKLSVYNSLGQMIRMEEAMLENGGNLLLNYRLINGTYLITIKNEQGKLIWKGWWIVEF